MCSTQNKHLFTDNAMTKQNALLCFVLPAKHDSEKSSQLNTFGVWSLLTYCRTKQIKKITARIAAK